MFYLVVVGEGAVCSMYVVVGEEAVFYACGCRRGICMCCVCGCRWGRCMVYLVDLAVCSIWSVWNSLRLSRNSVTVNAIFTVSDELSLEAAIKWQLNVLLQSLASIPQIYQSIFQSNRPERKTVYSKPCHVLRGEKCPDASRMFALKYRVRRDLNTDVSVFEWHARLATRWRLAVAKELRENCRDVGRAPARKVYTVICHRSGQHYLESGGPTYI